MRPHFLVWLSACATTLVAPWAGAAVSEPECLGPSIQADAAFRERFPELLEQLRAELPARRVLDACAGVELRAEGSLIVVSVSLPDGRTAARDVARPEDVLASLQALLLVPERVETARPAAAPAPPPERRAALRVEVSPPAERDVPPPSAKKAREHGFELSLVSGVRIGDGQYGYGLGVLSFVELKHWLIGFQGRADGYRSLRGSDPETALALGLLFGRRIDFGSTALDFTLGPAIAMRGASFGSSESVAVNTSGSGPVKPASMAPPGPQERDVGPVPRLLLGARWGFTPHSVFRTFVGIDAELGPRGNADAAPDPEPSGRMPAYTLGLALGATVGTR